MPRCFIIKPAVEQRIAAINKACFTILYRPIHTVLRLTRKRKWYPSVIRPFQGNYNVYIECICALKTTKKFKSLFWNNYLATIKLKYYFFERDFNIFRFVCFITNNGLVLIIWERANCLHIR